MFANERHSLIREMINRTGAVTASELASRFDVSIETIRRDLLALEKAGALCRVHGGAISQTHLKPAGEFNVRLDEHRLQKKELSLLAAELISEGDIIAIDAGTTAVEFAEVIKKLQLRFTVVTHCKAVFDIISACDNIECILIGGKYDKVENAFHGHMALEAYRNLHVSKAFIFPTGISLSLGVFDFHPDLLGVQHTLLEIADKIIILADSSKFEKTSLFRLCKLNPEHIYITDSDLPESVFELYKENNLTIFKGEEK